MELMIGAQWPCRVYRLSSAYCLVSVCNCGLASVMSKEAEARRYNMLPFAHYRFVLAQFLLQIS